jgi:Leucine-rich repeat (LRR) protein
MMKIVLNDNRAIDHVNGDDLMAMRATLKELHLARLSLTELPSEVAGLPKLRLLNIENNDLKDIPGALGHLSELSTLIVAGNPIRRKRIDFNNSTAELKKYLATKDTPHPSIIEDLGGGRNAATEALSRTLRDAAHYGTLTLAAPTGNSKKGGAAKGGDVLTEFPLAILEPKVANELTELVVTGHALTTLPTDKLRNLTRICHISLEGNCLGSAGGSGGGGGGGGGASMDPPLFAALLGLERLVSLKMKGNSLSDDDIAPLAGAPAEKKWPSLQEVDLSFNKLGSFPLILIEKSPKLRTLVRWTDYYCRCLVTFLSIGLLTCATSVPLTSCCQLLSNNQMSGDIEDEIPLLFLLPELMTIDLSENKLTSTGQFRFMKTLTNMNFEKNELRQCPPELGLLKLIYLGVAQNPLRGISADTLNGGTTKLLRYLENKLPKGWEEPAWVELARAGKSADGEPLSVAPPAPIHRTESGRRGARFFSSKTPEGQAAAAEGGGSNEVSLSARVNLEEKLSVVLKEIAKYSEELESKGNMSAAVAHATKKKLSVKKAEKLRIERQIKEL